MFDLRRGYRGDGARYEAVLVQIPQCLGQNLLADLADFTPQRIEAARPMSEHPNHQQGPFVGDARQQPADLLAPGGILMDPGFKLVLS